MIVLSGALVLVALVLLVFGALDRNLPYVYASIGVSVLSLLLLLAGILQRRGELSGEDQDDATTPVTDTSSERLPAPAAVGAVGAGVGAGVGAERSRPEPDDDADRTTELAVPSQATGEPARPASRRVAPDAAPQDDAAPTQDDAHPVLPDVDADDDDADDDDAGGDEVDASGSDDEPEDDRLVDDEPEDDQAEDDRLEDDEPEDDRLEDDELEDDELEEGSGVTVLVVSGRPRYHLEGCRVLRGKEPEALDRDDARTHGFSPCGVCKPDADETSAQQDDRAEVTAAQQDDPSFTEVLFGGPLSADRPAAEQPAGDADVQPVATDDAEPAAELRGEDPADDPALEVDAEASVEPSPDVAANPDELAEAGTATAVPEPERDDDADDITDDTTDDTEVEPVVEPVAADDLPLAGPDEDPVEQVPDTAAGPAQDRAAPAAPPTEVDAAEQAETAPTVPAPAKKAPAKKAPARKAPAKKAPAKKAPAKRAPADKAPAEQAAPEAAAAPEPVVRRPVVRTVRADALRPGVPGSGTSTTRVSARAAAPAAARPATGGPVVVVPDRDRFHRPECRFVRGVADATTLPKAAASRQGYAACGVCKP